MRSTPLPAGSWAQHESPSWDNHFRSSCPPWRDLNLGALRARGEPGTEITLPIDGNAHYLLATAEALPEVEGAPGNATVVLFQDITARKQAERVAQEQQRQMTILGERERMAHDLHDGVGQVLGYVSTQTQSAREYLRTGQIQIADAILAQLAGVTQDAHADIRNFILGVPPGSDDSADLVTALAQLVQRFGAQYGQSATFTSLSTNAPAWVTPYQQTQLLFVVQEALTNIRKHAQAIAAHVRFEAADYRVTVTVTDDGDGFDQHKVSADHFGLQIMKSRMAEAGGSLEVTSAPGQGTKIIAAFDRTPEADLPSDQLAGLRVLIADDQPLFRDGLHNLLTARGIIVAGVAANGAEAVQMATDLQPDIVIMDLHMPLLDGLDATEQIKQAFPQIQVLVLTIAESDATLVEALRRGASGYLLKNLDAQTLFTMLEQLRRGETVLTPTMATHLVNQFAHGDYENPVFTERQQEILRLMAQGYTYREIAAKVHLSESAVKYNAGQILARMHVRSRAQAIREAEKRGLL
ncbi:MAG: response regulator [Anaerolineales bacterium]|nr:response regulator [Anaerolineales bacterium]